MKKYYRFYECCKIVKGANRTAIYDLQRFNFYFIPNSVMEIFLDYENIKIKTLFNDYSSQRNQLMKYFDYLLCNELIFTTDNPETFPRMNSVFEKPHFLDFLFLEIDNLQKFKISFLRKNIDKTGVDHIVFINSSSSTENLNIVLNLLIDSRVKLITYISLFDKTLINETLNLKSKHERLKKIFFYNSPTELTQSNEDENVEYFEGTLSSLLNRRISSVKSLTLNIKTYLESLSYNLYYNRRAYINNCGEVKPSYNHKEYYGNITDENLNDIILKDNFQNIWKLTKDQIEVCKDCEYRYMCPDNRIPIKNKNMHYHKDTCNYNPYTNTWKQLT